MIQQAYKYLSSSLLPCLTFFKLKITNILKSSGSSPRMLLSWATCTYRAQFFNARNNYCIDKDFGIPTALVNESVTVNQKI